MQLKYHVVLNYTYERCAAEERRAEAADQIGIELYSANEALPVDEILRNPYPKQETSLRYKGRVVRDILWQFKPGFFFDDETAEEFFDAFVAPIEKDIPGNPDQRDDLHLLIITPEELLSFPVHIALKPVGPQSKEKKALLFDYNVSYLPSTLLERLVEAPSKRTALRKVVILCSHAPHEKLPKDFPPKVSELPGARKQTELLFQFWRSQRVDVEVLSDDPSHEDLKGIARQASKEAVIEAINGATLFIYIGHTVIDTQGHGWMIAGRKLDQDLISGQFIEQNPEKFSNLLLAHLDSCTSAIGRLFDFRDSLALSLLRSGVPSVIATQWEVSDENFLFSLELSFQSDLDNGKISKNLRKEFEKRGITLSRKVILSIQEKGHKWLITDQDNQQTYTVRKEENELGIYESHSRLEVVEGFYQKLMQGKPLDQAIREAEIEVLRRYSSKPEKYELSGCILLGSYLNPTS